MSVTAYDGRFSFKQDSLARLGSRAGDKQPMSGQQREAFNNSPFMQGVRKTEELCWEFTCDRDRKRAKADPSFQPQDSDFDAPKSFEYDKAINYYKVLGLDEFDAYEDVKKAYKKLSLIYHPDKSAGLPQEQKDENAAIFIEIKNAYQTLSDNPTRRQYDRDRDRDKASSELLGHKRKEKSHFNAAEVLAKLMEKQRPAGKVINIPCAVKLEKFFYGGHKAITRTRKVQDKFDGWKSQSTMYRIDVPRGAQEPHECLFRGRGDHHEDTRPDSLNFQVSAKPHGRVARKGNDLELKHRLPLPQTVHTEPYITSQTTSVNGRHILLWGRNPFYGVGRGDATLQVQLKGEGFTAESALSFTCANTLVSQLPAESHPNGNNSKTGILVTLRHLQTEAKVYLAVSPKATIGQIRTQAVAVLQLNGRGGAGLRFLRKLDDRGYTPYSDHEVLSGLREIPVAGVVFEKVPFNAERCMNFLQAVVKRIESPHFQAEWKRINEDYNKGQLSHPEAQTKLRALWQDHVAWLLTEFGFNPMLTTLQEKIRAAISEMSLPINKQMLSARNLGDIIDKYSAIEYKVPCSCPSDGVNDIVGLKLAGRKLGGTGLQAFLRRHGLSPPGGFEHPGSDTEEDTPLQTSVTPSSSSRSSLHGRGGLCDAASIRRRAKKQSEQPLFCKLELCPISDAITLFTKPTCNITILSNASQSTATLPGEIRPRQVFAVVLCSTVCSKRKAQREWSCLMEQLMPVLEVTIFRLIHAARRILPRPLADCSTWMELAAPRESCSDENHVLPIKRLADEAFKRGEYYTAMSLYTQCIAEAEAPPECSLVADSSTQPDANEKMATALSNRAACLAKVGHFQDSLADARRALEWKPRWGKAWGRAGFAAAYMGKAFGREAIDCYIHAVEFEPSAGNVHALQELVVKAMTENVDPAHAEKEKGNQALRNNEIGLAIACYTVGLALLPKQQFVRGVDGKMELQSDENSLFRSILYANRCGAFCKLKSWSLAIEDGQKAVAAKADYVQARNKLGAAYLGAGFTEKAYSEFARGLSLEGTNRASLGGRQACLQQIPLWKSAVAKKRHQSRFAIDLARPKGSTKVYAISDVFFDHRYNEDWAHSINDFKFSEDVLIVAGNMCDTRNALERALTTLTAKFRRVFYVPGNHEMWLAGEITKYPDTMAKLLSIFDLCDELGVDIFPAAVCEGVFIVPLLSWYTSEFDCKDPFPDISDETDNHCRWPIDKDSQVWKYMLTLNGAHLRHLYHGTVITFSHFLPKTSLIPPIYTAGKVRKTLGCEMIDEQVRAVGSKLHIFGHTRRNVWGKEDGVVYANFYNGLEDEHESSSPIYCIWNGWDLCKQEVDIC